MLELDIMGNSSNAAIVAIGALFFEPMTSEIGAQFYAKIDPVDAAKYGEFEPDAVIRWMKKSDKERLEIINTYDSYSLVDALVEFSNWICQIEDYETRVVWNNRASFDNAFNAVGMTKPWAFWNERDVSTANDLVKMIKHIDLNYRVSYKCLHHNALDRALYHAKYVSAACNALKK